MKKDDNVRRNFSYDKLEDMDIHNFLQSLPQRQISKHIRIALRLYMSQLNEGSINYGGIRQEQVKEDEVEESTIKSKEKDDYVDLNVNELGK